MKAFPRVYESTVTQLDGYGIGGLTDAISCKVTEERNGEFYLEMTYPTFGSNASLLVVGRIIAAKPNMYDPVQAFRINKIEKSLDGMMDILAYHISYDLAQNAVGSFSVTDPQDAVLYLMAYMKDSGWEIRTDFTESKSFSVEHVMPVRYAMLGKQGSMLDVWGGEWKFDNWTECLYQHRGTTRNVQVAYGKNLSSFKETDELGPYDAVIPYAYIDGTEYKITNSAISPDYPAVKSDIDYGFPRYTFLDVSEDYDGDNPPTQTDLYNKAVSYINSHNPKSTANMATGFLDLQKLLGATERVDLCDTIYLTVRPYGVQNLKLTVIKTVYDVLLDEYVELQVGDRRITLADELAPILK